MVITSPGNVGIGTTAPGATLDVNGNIAVRSGGITFPDGTIQSTAASVSSVNNGNVTIGPANGSTIVNSSGIFHASGTSNPVVTNQGAYVGWNYLVGLGETDFINNEGGGPGGFAFFNTPPSGTPLSLLAFLSGSGQLGLGTQSPGARLEVNGNVKLTAGSGASVTFPDGTVQATAWNGTTLGGDYAESVDVLGDRSKYEPGDVIVIDPLTPGSFAKSQEPYSKLVAGVYSTKPGLVGRRTTADRPNKDTEIPMAMLGIVPVKVNTENGPVKVGDLLVSSSRPGYAMRGTDKDYLPGAIIGKALAPLQVGAGLIEALISIQ